MKYFVVVFVFILVNSIIWYNSEYIVVAKHDIDALQYNSHLYELEGFFGPVAFPTDSTFAIGDTLVVDFPSYRRK